MKRRLTSAARDLDEVDPAVLSNPLDVIESVLLLWWKRSGELRSELGGLDRLSNRPSATARWVSEWRRGVNEAAHNIVGTVELDANTEA